MGSPRHERARRATEGHYAIDGKAGGIAVMIGARVGALAGPSEIFVSQTVRDLTAGSGLSFDDVGEQELKGVPGIWRLSRVTDPIAT